MGERYQHHGGRPRPSHSWMHRSQRRRRAHRCTPEIRSPAAPSTTTLRGDHDGMLTRRVRATLERGNRPTASPANTTGGAGLRRRDVGDERGPAGSGTREDQRGHSWKSGRQRQPGTREGPAGSGTSEDQRGRGGEVIAYRAAGQKKEAMVEPQPWQRCVRGEPWAPKIRRQKTVPAGFCVFR